MRTSPLYASATDLPGPGTGEHLELIADEITDVRLRATPASRWHRDRAGVARLAHEAARAGDVGEAVRLAVLGKVPVIRYAAANTLADRLNLDHGLVAAALADLERDGWVVIEGDGRAVDPLGPQTLDRWGRP